MIQFLDFRLQISDLGLVSLLYSAIGSTKEEKCYPNQQVL